MSRVLLVGSILLAAFSGGLNGQAQDTRLDDAVKEIAILKRAMADQDRRALDQERRIIALERTVRSLQTTVLAATRPVAVNNRWRTPEGWAALKIGMSRAEVLDILGEPKSTDSVIDRQTLWYKDPADSLIGSVVITDDRVSEVASRRFQVYMPLPK